MNTNGCALVTLTWPEINLALWVASERVLFALREQVPEKHGAENDLGGVDYHFAGCIGELATAKHLNLFWPPAIGEFNTVDVGGKVQVRAGRRADHRLMLHHKDGDDVPFVFVMVIGAKLPRVTLRGWCYARDGKRQEYWTDPNTGRPCFLVPGEILRPMGEIAGVLS